MMTYLR